VGALTAGFGTGRQPVPNASERMVRACSYGANPSESMLPFTVVACPSQEYANSLKAA
jgi:hypothetical protein